MRTWLVLSSALVAVLASRAGADVPADSIKLVLKTPMTLDDAGSTTATRFGAPGPDVKPRQFNKARCKCDEAGFTQNVMFEATWAMGTAPADSAGTQIFAWAGSDCANAMDRTTREMRCTRLDGIPDAVTIAQTENMFVGVGELLTPGTNADANPCSEDLSSVTYGLYTSTDSEATITKVVEEAIDVDMKAPPVPTTLTVKGQEGQLSLEWEALASQAGDIQYFQALCSTGAGGFAHDEATHEAQYDTEDSICGAALSTTIAAAVIANDDVQTGRPIAAADLGDLAFLDSLYVCGQATGGTTSSITLEGLTNGEEYIVVLVSVDKAGNPAAVFVPRTISPQPVTDFWEDLNGEDPDIEGGLCLIESAYGGGRGGLMGALRAWRDELRQTVAGRWLVERYYAWGAPLAAAARESVIARVVLAVVMLPLIAIALCWHAIGLPAMLAIAAALVWLRRRRLKLAVGAAIAFAPALAAAQSVTPYWDDDLAAESAEVGGPKWHFGVRLGPYLPSIDDERFASPGPYERMFGSGSWMPTMDLHRVFGSRLGQLGGGLSVGYFGKTADAYIPDTMDERAEGNENSLKIVPFELTAIWRFSQLHDNWNIPVVPYLRGGGAYYLWWVRRPDGDLAKACPENMTNCDRAIGSSLGLVGAVGIAIRAEGVDPDAARSMRDSGLEHAGFYAEIATGWVDGFGSAKKLSLGDTTWSAGIDFEF